MNFSPAGYGHDIVMMCAQRKDTFLPPIIGAMKSSIVDIRLWKYYPFQVFMHVNHCKFTFTYDDEF